MNYCFMFYHKIDSDDFIKTTIKTLKKYTNTEIHIYSDNTKFEITHKIEFKDLQDRRMLCKSECILNFINQLKDGDHIMVADVDLYFLDDPFSVFNREFDLAYTTRPHIHSKPVNSGVHFFRICDGIKNLIAYNIQQAINPTWLAYKYFKRDKYGVDWTIGQDFLNACHKDRKYIENRFKIKILDVGAIYNFCPAVDRLGFDQAEKMLKMAYKNRNVCVLHLKSELKPCLYDGWLEDAIVDNPTEVWNWKQIKK